MANLRRGGSAAVFFFEGNLPSFIGEALEAALRTQRFRSIETAASEEVSIGWVSPDDPTGESFPREVADLDRGLWLQVRVDKKKLPMRWVAIYRASAEREAGRKLNGKERKALKEDLQEKLLPRILPAVQILDVLVDPKGRRVLLFSTSQGVREEFAKLWRNTFPAVALVPASAYEWALRRRLVDAQRRWLDEVAPVKWPRRDGERSATTPADAPAAEVEA